MYPAAYPEVIAVSAADTADTLTSWSNRGAEIDLSAPGNAIESTYKNGGYATFSGTSMAAPHVAGVAALLYTRALGAYDVNGNNAWDPGEIQTKLQDTATDLGVAGRDDMYGYGLVNARRAAE